MSRDLHQIAVLCLTLGALAGSGCSRRSSTVRSLAPVPPGGTGSCGDGVSDRDLLQLTSVPKGMTVEPPTLAISAIDLVLETQLLPVGDSYVYSIEASTPVEVEVYLWRICPDGSTQNCAPSTQQAPLGWAIESQSPFEVAPPPELSGRATRIDVMPCVETVRAAEFQLPESFELPEAARVTVGPFTCAAPTATSRVRIPQTLTYDKDPVFQQLWWQGLQLKNTDIFDISKDIRDYTKRQATLLSKDSEDTTEDAKVQAMLGVLANIGMSSLAAIYRYLSFTLDIADLETQLAESTPSLQLTASPGGLLLTGDDCSPAGAGQANTPAGDDMFGGNNFGSTPSPQLPAKADTGTSSSGDEDTRGQDETTASESETSADSFDPEARIEQDQTSSSVNKVMLIAGILLGVTGGALLLYNLGSNKNLLNIGSLNSKYVPFNMLKNFYVNKAAANPGRAKGWLTTPLSFGSNAHRVAQVEVKFRNATLEYENRFRIINGENEEAKKALITDRRRQELERLLRDQFTPPNGQDANAFINKYRVYIDEVAENIEGPTTDLDKIDDNGDENSTTTPDTETAAGNSKPTADNDRVAKFKSKLGDSERLLTTTSSIAAKTEADFQKAYIDLQLEIGKPTTALDAQPTEDTNYKKLKDFKDNFDTLSATQRAEKFKELGMKDNLDGIIDLLKQSKSKEILAVVEVSETGKTIRRIEYGEHLPPDATIVKIPFDEIQKQKEFYTVGDDGKPKKISINPEFENNLKEPFNPTARNEAIRKATNDGLVSTNTGKRKLGGTIFALVALAGGAALASGAVGLTQSSLEPSRAVASALAGLSNFGQRIYQARRQLALIEAQKVSARVAVGAN